MDAYVLSFLPIFVEEQITSYKFGFYGGKFGFLYTQRYNLSFLYILWCSINQQVVLYGKDMCQM